MTLQIEARAALERMAPYPSRDVFIRASGHVYWPQPGELPEPGEVWIAGGEHGAWSVDDLTRALERVSGVTS